MQSTVKVASRPKQTYGQTVKELSRISKEKKKSWEKEQWTKEEEQRMKEEEKSWTPEEEQRIKGEQTKIQDEKEIPPMMRPGDAVGERLTLEDLAAKQDEKPVLVGMTFYSLYDINPQSQCFSAELTVKLWWWENPDKKAGVYDWKEEKEKKFPPEKFKVPKIFFSNSRELVDVAEIPPSCEVREEWPVGAVGYERRVRGTFEELFELDFFPYDVQALTVQLRVNSKEDFHMKRYLALNMGKQAHAMIPQVKSEGRFSEWKRYEASALAGKYIQGKPLLYEAHICLWRRHRCKLSETEPQEANCLAAATCAWPPRFRLACLLARCSSREGALCVLDFPLISNDLPCSVCWTFQRCHSIRPTCSSW